MPRRFVLFSALLLAGCGTTRVTDTGRAATEMLLVSQAVDAAVGRIDFAPLAGKTVYVDTEYLDKTLVDRGYVVSCVRQQLLAAGALLKDEAANAIYSVEIRVGAVGTDRHQLLVGSPAMSLPALVPGVPTSIPELALVKKTDQKGVAKLSVFAYNRVSGRAVWQSGTVEEVSTLKDLWVFGTGPFSHGTIRKGTELAGEPLPKMSLHIPFVTSEADPPAAPASAPAATPPTVAHEFAGADAPPTVQPVPAGLLGLVGGAAVADRPLIR